MTLDELLNGLAARIRRLPPDEQDDVMAELRAMVADSLMAAPHSKAAVMRSLQRQVDEA